VIRRRAHVDHPRGAAATSRGPVLLALANPSRRAGRTAAKDNREMPRETLKENEEN
jgi:hypothetical protein